MQQAPPEASRTDHCVSEGSSPAVPVRLQTLRKRSDFLKAARAGRAVTPGFILQMRKRADGNDIRAGFTCSKKVGNAVARNRAKRRLREVARLVLPEHGRPGCDYVLIGRATETANRPFAQMRTDLLKALNRVHAGSGG